MTLLDQLRTAKVYDLGQPYFTGMPHWPTHPPFATALTKQHGEIVLANGASSAAELITLGGHVGTHIDALCHFSCGGKFYRDQSYEDLGIGTVAPILRRGVLFDVAGWVGVEALPIDYVIKPELLSAMSAAWKLRLEPGDVALLRTGWGRYWRDPVQFLTGGLRQQAAHPGPQLPGAQWLSGHRIFAAGADTVAFECVPAGTMPVHVHLLVECGIHIIECLNLEELARDEVREFALVAAPMKLEGGTGAPVRPLALVG